MTTQLYYKVPDGEPTSNLSILIPQVINPQALTDEELGEYGVARCSMEHPVVEWWQRRGSRQTDTSTIPHIISYTVEDISLEDVKVLAWQRIKDQRDERQGGLMPYIYPSGDTHHNEMTDKVVRDLSASTTAALALASQGVTDAVMPWTTHENVTHTLTPAQMIVFGLTATQWHSAIHVQSQTLRAQIDAATTVAEIVAVQWGE